MKHTAFTLFIIAITAFGCGTKKNMNKETAINTDSTVEIIQTPTIGGSGVRSLPPIVIYKMRGDYADLIPISLTPDGKSVSSYPAPGDVKHGSAYATPLKLNDGWWYDRRGVGRNTAFIRMTYPEYAALPSAPDFDELIRLIVDRNPFTDIVRCDRTFFEGGNVTVDRLNAYIAAGLPGAQR